MDYSDYPVNGKYGRFGGSLVPETLVAALSELTDAYARFRRDHDFQQQLSGYLSTFAEGQPLCTTPKTSPRNSAAPGSISSVRTLLTAAPIRSTIRSARHCLRSAWGKHASSLKQEQGSTG